MKTLEEQMRLQLQEIEIQIDAEMDLLIQIHEERPHLSMEQLIQRQQGEFVALMWDRHLKRKMLKMLEERKTGDAAYRYALPAKVGAEVQ